MKYKALALFMSVMLVLAGCGQQPAEEGTSGSDGAESAPAQPVKLKVASLIPPMTEVLDLVKPKLQEEGIELEVVILSDNVQPNNALANKEVDANFFQHVPYMEEYNANNGSELVPVVPIYNAVFGAYSKRYSDIEELPDGATIAIPNDPSNIGRSLVMFEKEGLIKLKEGVGIKATQADIVENNRNFKFQEVDLLMLARTLDDVDMVAMTPAYAKPLGLTPNKDALITEGNDSAFTITLIARKDNVDSEPIQKLAEAMTSPEVKAFFEENYSDIALPAF
ncbi:MULTISPECIES: MetQ/NlpA family ABC transporter substrate-binding protein [Paenibacillus]|uniref:Lipoprotein n=1 Tax=Paenibacillus campinasensis TaxID=66347 RepID=A0A268EIY7_9BACL|nr:MULTISPECIES: MetQ/NlpA family ABC transporter substrate-binding protein [Paenibacillus]MUG67948.1 ABC transporter substrate-binding protein [Paenibacillus campinasensis]PAD73098.1 ABC transporter substrate-binding protein [Paenibacillus campinasensis]PAK49663.1 ABC transporter substrate-binding protein [Paenibacillus sp. 7541]